MSIMWKLIYKYKFFEVKNGDNFIEIILLLLAANLTISDISDQLSSW